MCNFLDFMDSPSYTYMKWPLAIIMIYFHQDPKKVHFIAGRLWRTVMDLFGNQTRNEESFSHWNS